MGKTRKGERSSRYGIAPLNLDHLGFGFGPSSSTLHRSQLETVLVGAQQDLGSWSSVSCKILPSRPILMIKSFRPTFIDRRVTIMPSPSRPHEHAVDFFVKSINYGLSRQMTGDQNLGRYSVFLNRHVESSVVVEGVKMTAFSRVPDLVVVSPRGCSPEYPFFLEVAVSQSLAKAQRVMKQYLHFFNTFGGIVVHVKEPRYRPPNRAPVDLDDPYFQNFTHSIKRGYRMLDHTWAGPYSVTLYISRRGEDPFEVVEYIFLSILLPHINI